jgi:hypothetical protein
MLYVKSLCCMLNVYVVCWPYSDIRASQMAVVNAEINICSNIYVNNIFNFPQKHRIDRSVYRIN